MKNIQIKDFQSNVSIQGIPGDVGVNIGNEAFGFVKMLRTDFLNLLNFDDDRGAYWFSLLDTDRTTIFYSFMGFMLPDVSIPKNCEVIILRIIPHNLISTDPHTGYKIKAVEVVEIFDPEAESPKKQNTHSGNDTVGFQENLSNVESEIMSNNTSSNNNSTVNSTEKQTSPEPLVTTEILGLLYKKYRPVVLNGVSKSRLERTSLGVAKNLAKLTSENKITNEEALGVMRMFYANCSGIGTIPSEEVILEELRQAKNGERLIQEVPEQKLDSTNAVSILSELYGNRVRWNELGNYIELDGEKFEDGNQFYLSLGTEHGLKASRELAKDTLVMVAKQNSYHPIRDYLDEVAKKHTDYSDVESAKAMLHAMLEVFGITDDWERETAIKCFLGAVARVNDPGAKVDLMLVLKSPQGYGKSTLINTLAGCGYVDIAGDPGNKDGLMEMHSGWIIEIAEVEKFTRTKEAFHTKSIITRRTDIFRPPYGAEPKEFKRQFIFIGTTNEDDLFLDPTGNRRYIVANVAKEVDFKDVETQRDEFWACLVHLYRAGYQWWLTKEETQSQSERNQFTVVTDSRIELIEAYVSNKTYIKIMDVIRQALLIEPNEPGYKKAEFEASKMLKQLGFTKRRKVVDGKKQTIWEAPVDAEIQSLDVNEVGF